MSLALTSTLYLPPLSKFEAYAAAVFALPVLSETEEMDLAKEVQLNQNQGAAWKLATSFLRLPVKIAREHVGYGLPLEDLAQEGNLGLLKAIKKFDPSRGVRLSVIASVWIKSEIRAYILKNWRMVKTITTQKMRHLFFTFKKQRQVLESAGHSGIELRKMLAKKLDCTQDELRDIEARLLGEESWDAIMDGQTRSSDFLKLENGASSFTDIYDLNSVDGREEENDKNVKRLALALESLPERTRTVIELRHLQEPPETLEALSKRFNVSVGRIHQIESQGLVLLKDYMD